MITIEITTNGLDVALNNLMAGMERQILDQVSRDRSPSPLVGKSYARQLPNAAKVRPLRAAKSDPVMYPLKSSSIKAVGYEEASQKLSLQFTSGPTLYTFYRVPPRVFHELRKATSAGSYYHQNIQGRYATP